MSLQSADWQFLQRVRPEDQALLDGERSVLEWLRNQNAAPPGSDGQPSGRWIEAFMNAGRAALAQEVPTENWLYLRIELKSFAVAARVITKAIYPTLTKLVKAGDIQRFWFMLKHDTCYHLRLRLFGATEVLRSKAREGLLKALRPGMPRSGVTTVRELIYEPETALFGGPWAMEYVHELFHHDSLFAMAWLGTSEEEQGGLSKHQVSLIMLQHLLRFAGLDTFERWDVWTKVYKIRPGDTEQLAIAWEAQKSAMSLLVAIDPQAVAAALPERSRDLLMNYANGLRQVGENLWDGHRRGLLERGLRHVLATNVVFHWNRLLFTGGEQVMLAYFMSKATTPLED